VKAPRSRRRRWLVALAILAAPPVAVLMLSLWTRSRLEHARDAFGGESLDEWAERFPVRAPNAQACALVAHAEAVLPHRASKQDLASMSAAERASDPVRAALGARRLLASARLAQDDAPLDPEPAFAAWRDAHAGELDAALRLLDVDEPPDWGWAGEWGRREKPLWTMYRFDQFLLACAMDAHVRGDAAGAEQVLRAAFIVEEALSRGPDFAPPIRSSAGLAVLRRIRPADADAWIARLDAINERAHLDDVLRERASSMRRYALHPWPSRATGLQRLALPLERIGRRFGASQQIHRLARIDAALMAEGSACKDPVDLVAAALEPPGYLKPWLGVRYEGELDWAFPLLRRVELDAAMTRRVLTLDAGLDPSGGHCPELVTHRIEPDGRVTVAWAAENGPRFTFRPRVAVEAPVLASAPTLSGP